MKPATPQQLQYIHAALHRKGLLRHKAEMVSSYTNGRSDSSKDMTVQEASEMLQALNDTQAASDKEKGAKDKMIRSIIAMAREMGVIERVAVVNGEGQVREKSNYSKFNEWLLTKSCVKKENLNKCTYEELPKLVTQYKAIYTSWLHRFH